MTEAVYTWSCPAPPLHRAEILRYAGCREETPELAPLLEDCLDQLLPALRYEVCYRRLSTAVEGERIFLGADLQIQSSALAAQLEGCEQALLFAATIGLGADRLISRYSRLSPTKALLFQAIGAERIEALCDAFCQEMQNQLLSEGLHPRRRFSPGYGDLPLTLQKDLFRLLDCSRKIGLSLNASLLMSPSKSVTALMGLSPTAGDEALCQQNKCSQCGKQNCTYRRTQNHAHS